MLLICRILLTEINKWHLFYFLYWPTKVKHTLLFSGIQSSRHLASPSKHRLCKCLCEDSWTVNVPDLLDEIRWCKCMASWPVILGASKEAVMDWPFPFFFFSVLPHIVQLYINHMWKLLQVQVTTQQHCYYLCIYTCDACIQWYILRHWQHNIKSARGQNTHFSMSAVCVSSVWALCFHRPQQISALIVQGMCPGVGINRLWLHRDLWPRILKLGVGSLTLMAGRPWWPWGRGCAILHRSVFYQTLYSLCFLEEFVALYTAMYTSCLFLLLFFLLSVTFVSFHF